MSFYWGIHFIKCWFGPFDRCCQRTVGCFFGSGWRSNDGPDSSHS